MLLLAKFNYGTVTKFFLGKYFFPHYLAIENVKLASRDSTRTSYRVKQAARQYSQAGGTSLYGRNGTCSARHSVSPCSQSSKAWIPITVAFQ